MDAALSPLPPRARLRDRLMRRTMHTWWRFSRPMTLGVRAAILRPGEVFLVRHGYIAGWHLPGGGVEAGETAEDALRREVLEEGAIAVEGSPRLHGLFFNHHVSRRDHVAVYVVEQFRVLGPRAPDREILEAGFFPLDRLPDATTRATRARLAEIAGAQTRSPTW